MTLAQAQAAAATLRECLLDNGVRRVSIELQPGVAGSGWYVPTFKRGMGHHIASRPSQGLTPGLATVKNGRGGANPLSGPLANCYGGYDLVARIITLAWANHPGAGGPCSVPGWGTVPKDNGRPYILGWEFEGGYEAYTDEMHDFMARCGAGTLDWLGTLPGNPGPAPLECWGEHKDPWAPGRKIDRLGYTAASGRERIAAVRGNTNPRTSKEDDDMLVFVTDGGPWFAYNGFRRRYVDGSEARRLIDLGLARPEPKTIPTAALEAMPLDTTPSLGGLKPLLLDAVREGMAADNAEQADEIVDRLAERLTGTTG